MRQRVQRRRYAPRGRSRPHRTCAYCGGQKSQWASRCPWCRPADADEEVDERAALRKPVRHRVRVECLTCARPATLADAKAHAGRCPVCAGTLVWREVL